MWPTTGSKYRLHREGDEADQYRHCSVIDDIGSTERTMKTLIAPALLLFLLSSFRFAVDATATRQELDIYEAVFRWQFVHNASALQQRAQLYFIAVGENDTDASDELLQRFAGHSPPVRKLSDSHRVQGQGIRDKKTGAKGVAFRATIMQWLSDTTVIVRGGYEEGELSASGNTYTVMKEHGQWHVTKDILDFISRTGEQRGMPTTYALRRRRVHER